jgi:DNA-binding protein HU-beta
MWGEGLHDLNEIHRSPATIRFSSTKDGRMNRNDLAALLAENHELSKAAAARMLDTVIDALCTELKKGNTVALSGFGSFKLAQRAARTGRNPATGDKIKIAARKLVKFSPSTSLAGLVDPKFAKARAEKAAAKQAAPARKAAAKTTAAPAKKAAAKKAAAKKAA